MKYYYEVLWYTAVNENGDYEGDYESRTFTNKQSAMNFYNKHKNDTDKFGWWVTKRYADDDTVADDIIY